MKYKRRIFSNTTETGNRRIPGGSAFRQTKCRSPVGFLNYPRDISIPKDRMQWNFIVDLPFGKGKAIAGNARRFANAVIGGWQLSGTGSMVSNNNWANFSKLQIYGKNTPVKNCTSGTCIAG